MDAAGIAERARLRPRPPATAEVNGRVEEPHPDADPTMTREASEEIGAWPEQQRLPAVFQWYDPVQGRWRDRVSDRAFRHAQELQETRMEGREEGEAIGEARGWERGRLEATIDSMREFLGPELAPAHLDRIEAAWRQDGPPSDALRRVRDVLRAPGEWRSLL